MCCILFKWNKLRPLLQVAKLSVYNLSNKHVFYSGFCCVVCIIKNLRWITACVTLFYFIPSTSGWARQHEVKSFERSEGCGQRLDTFGFWLCEPGSCTTGQSERHHSFKSCSSAWRVCRHQSDPKTACPGYNMPSSCMWVCYLFVCILTSVSVLHF